MSFQRINNVTFGTNIVLSSYINLYHCKIGDNTKIGSFVEIQKGATIGQNCKISSHSFICEGVHISDNCFIGHGVMFINDNYPQSVTQENQVETDADWQDRFVTTTLHDHVSIGSNVTLLGNITIGKHAMIGAGSVVTKDIPEQEIWAGNPAKFIRKRALS